MMTPESIKTMSDTEGFYIRTFTGKKLYWDRVHEHDYDIIDIAHSLAQRVRWSGHTKRQGNRIMSIGQHSCYVHDILPDPLKKQGLLHDAAEAYMPDFPSPLKHWMLSRGDRAIDDLETEVDRAIGRKLNVQFPRDPLVKRADLQALSIEHRDLMPDKTSERKFMLSPITKEPLKLWTIQRTEREFLLRYYAITERERR